MPTLFAFVTTNPVPVAPEMFPAKLVPRLSAPMTPSIAAGGDAPTPTPDVKICRCAVAPTIAPDASSPPQAAGSSAKVAPAAPFAVSIWPAVAAPEFCISAVTLPGPMTRGVEIIMLISFSFP